MKLNSAGRPHLLSHQSVAKHVAGSPEKGVDEVKPDAQKRHHTWTPEQIVCLRRALALASSHIW